MKPLARDLQQIKEIYIAITIRREKKSQHYSIYYVVRRVPAGLREYLLGVSVRLADGLSRIFEDGGLGFSPASSALLFCIMSLILVDFSRSTIGSL